MKNLEIPVIKFGDINSEIPVFISRRYLIVFKVAAMRSYLILFISEKVGGKLHHMLISYMLI